MKKKKLWVRLLAALLAAAVLLTGLMIWKNKKTKAAAAARAQSLNTESLPMIHSKEFLQWCPLNFWKVFSKSGMKC